MEHNDSMYKAKLQELSKLTGKELSSHSSMVDEFLAHAKLMDSIQRDHFGLNTKDNIYGATALHRAVMQNDIPAVEHLMRIGANKNIKDNDGNTPLFIAASKGYDKAVNALLKDQENDHINALLKDQENDHIEAKGVEKQVIPNDLTTSTSFMAKGKNFVHSLLGNSVSLEAIIYRESLTPLQAAVKNGHTQTVQELMGKANKEVRTTYRATSADIVSTPQAFLRNEGNTPLHTAVNNNRLDIASVLVDAGAYKEARNALGETSLSLAAKNNNINAVKYLLENGADREARDKNGRTPLHVAAQNGHIGIVRHLLGEDIQSDKDAIDNDGNTPLHLAAENNHSDAVKELIESGATTDVKNNDDKSPLDVAAEGWARLHLYDQTPEGRQAARELWMELR